MQVQSIQIVTRSAKYQDLTLHIYFILALNLESYNNFREIFSEILNIYKEDLSKRDKKIFNLYLIEISTPPAWILDRVVCPNFGHPALTP